MLRPIELSVPEASLDPAECVRAPEAWWFPGVTAEGLTNRLRVIRLDASTVDTIGALARCDAAGCAVMPSRALIESLSPDARSALYGELARHTENRLHAFAARRPASYGPWSAITGLSPRVRELLARGTWTLDGDHAFSDVPWLCERLTTDAERVEALRALRARYGLEVSVRVPPVGDIEPMVRYWSAGDPDRVRAVLIGASGAGDLAPVSELLPSWARARLDRFPTADEAERDGAWTALRFFNDDAPELAPGPRSIRALLQDEFVELPPSEARMGDMAAFLEADGSVVHAASLVAGQVLFTKSGRSSQRPWVLMRLDDLRALYPRVSEVRWYRRAERPLRGT